MATRSKVKVLGTTYYITTSGSEDRVRRIEEQMNEQLAAIQDDPAFASLSAVQNQRVHLIMLGDMYASGPRTGDGLRVLAGGMYPGLAG